MANAQVLIIHENPDLLSAVQSHLQGIGSYDVYEGNSVAAAMAAARQQRPDLLILDANMPVEEGSMIISELQNDPVLGSVPVIYISVLGT
jgi:CheY-like chemotaxis protein